MYYDVFFKEKPHKDQWELLYAIKQIEGGWHGLVQGDANYEALMAINKTCGMMPVFYSGDGTLLAAELLGKFSSAKDPSSSEFDYKKSDQTPKHVWGPGGIINDKKTIDLQKKS